MSGAIASANRREGKHAKLLNSRALAKQGFIRPAFPQCFALPAGQLRGAVRTKQPS
jgi:hypothetical protein